MNAAKTIAIVQSFSPFVLPVVVERYDRIALDEVMNDRGTAEGAAQRCAERINGEIERTLKESAKLRRKYDEFVAIQKKIEQYRSEGKKVPVEWIRNPFHRRWYAREG